MFRQKPEQLNQRDATVERNWISSLTDYYENQYKIIYQKQNKKGDKNVYGLVVFKKATFFL